LITIAAFELLGRARPLQPWARPSTARCRLRGAMAVQPAFRGFHYQFFEATELVCILDH
jgi:hypothetical protein